MFNTLAKAFFNIDDLLMSPFIEYECNVESKIPPFLSLN